MLLIYLIMICVKNVYLFTKGKTSSLSKLNLSVINASKINRMAINGGRIGRVRVTALKKRGVTCS